MKNKAVSELYEPGSTFKIITTSMALEEGWYRSTKNFIVQENSMLTVILSRFTATNGPDMVPSPLNEVSSNPAIRSL